MSSGDTYFPGHPFGPVEAYTEGWPAFAQGWLGGEFRPRPRPTQLSGWSCSGCGRGFSPYVRECSHCPESAVAPSTGSRDLTWNPDAAEPDET